VAVLLLLLLQGTEEQKRELLPGMADNSLAGCWALTEPSNGSDASALTCTATKVRPGLCTLSPGGGGSSPPHICIQGGERGLVSSGERPIVLGQDVGTR
jgi:hypothetical protein